jgi:glycogen(starch) synthase
MTGKEGGPMRVLMYGWEFPPYISGGLGTACFGMTQGLAGLDTEILFVIPKIKGESGPSHVSLLSASDIIFPHRPIEFRSIGSYLKPYLNMHSYHSEIQREYVPYIPAISDGDGPSGRYGMDLFVEVMRYGRSAGALAKREKFDIIHSHDWMTVHAGMESRRVSGSPWIYHVHALEFDRSGESINPRIYEIERCGLEEADHVIAVSHYTKDVIVHRYGIDPDRVTVVHNAVSGHGEDRPRVKKRPDEKIVLFLGRITFQKGPDYFIEAASLVLKAIPDVTFIMAGAGDMMPRMVERVAELGMGKQFRFTGFLKGSEVEDVYSRSDVYVMPSVSEPFGISPLEAVLCDVPVIISRQSGVSEILRHALKVDFWNVSELAGRIIAVLQYPVLADEMVDRSREEIAAIQWSAAAEKILSVYRKVCG